MSICTDVISPSSKPSLKTNAERKRKKSAFLNIRTPVLTVPSTQLSPDAGPTIIQDEIDFLHEALSAYTKGGLKLLKKRYHELPLILGSDSNIPFDTDEELRCVQFLKKELNLDFVSGNTLETTRHEQQLSQKGSVSTRASSNSAGNGSVPTQTSVSQGYRSARTIALHIQHQSVSQGYQ
ncbi:hypothetical protein PV325_008291 [Microctonus aethiopoides]|nr:hypothetical protein PV325_008291 [Microctonus aethiopoides]